MGRMGAAALVVLLVATLAVLLVRVAADRLMLREACTAQVGDVEVRIGLEEAERAAALAAAAARRGLPARPTATTALASALQGATLPNGDSLGLKDERGARALASALQGATLPNGDSLGLKDERGARALASALLGYSAASFTCELRPASVAAEEPGGRGLTPRAALALEAVEAAFGKQRVGGFDPQGVRSGHMDGSAHYSGRAVDVFYRPVGVANRRAGWATAQWLVANADRLDLATVIYDGKIWTARRSAQGWRQYVPPGGNTANPTLMHRDHVHLDVP